MSYKVNGAVQAAIGKALEALPQENRPAVKAVHTAYRSLGDVQQAVALAMQPAETTATTAPATTPQAQASTEKPAKAKKVLPDAPEGWEPGYSNNGFVRYARRLKANGQPVTAYRTGAAATKAEKATVDEFKAAGIEGRFIVHNHTTGVSQAFDNWADAYAFSCTMFSPDLARSVVVSIGGDKGLARMSSLTGLAVKQRAIAAIVADDEKGGDA